MKLLAAALFGSVLIAAAPAYAQDKDMPHADMGKGDMGKGDMDKGDMGKMDMHHDAAPAHHAMSHSRRHVSYTRNYKSDQEEEEQTKQLNMQYRGVPKSGM